MVSKVNRVQKKQSSPSFDDISWSAIAVATLLAAWFLMSYRNQFPASYNGPLRIIIGIAIGTSLACIGVALWKTSYWKLIAVAVALVWLVALFMYIAFLSGPLIDPNSIKIPW